ncbi:MAG: hypothetical protein JKY65_20630 [Planctomycetes bacterium]|nr:hypothetical protein [Planctomycetota bacterium]
MMASWRITWRALAAVARKDAGQNRLLSVFLYPWVLGTIGLLVGISWVPDWLWDLVGVARLRPSSPEVILRAWFLIGLAPAVWLGVRANVLAESRQGGWRVLTRLPVRTSMLLLGKALPGLVLVTVLAGVGLLLAVTASAFGEITGDQALGAAAGLTSAVSSLYTLCFLSALLGRQRLLLWSALGAGFVATGGALHLLPGAELYRYPLGPELLVPAAKSTLGALVALVVIVVTASARGGRLLSSGLGPLRTVDLTRAALVAGVVLIPWALDRPATPPVRLAGVVVRAPAPLELEIERLEGPASEQLLAALSADLTWLRDLGLNPVPLAVANAPRHSVGTFTRRRPHGARGVILDAAFSAPDFVEPEFRTYALTAILELQPGWELGIGRLLALGLPRFRAQPERPHEDLRAAWALSRIEGSCEDWLERWEDLERAVGTGPATALAGFLLESFEARHPGGVETWVRAAAAHPGGSSPPAELIDQAALEALTKAQSASLLSLPNLSQIAVEPTAGGLRYRARLVAPAPGRGVAPLSSARLVVWVALTRSHQRTRGEAFLGAPGFSARGAPSDWASLKLPAGAVRWQLGLSLPAPGGDLVFAAGEDRPQ